MFQRATVAAMMVLAVAGCKKSDDNRINFTSAINNYYSAHPACLWRTSQKFPVQADTNDASKTQRWDALVDQGLLVRTTAEKKILIIASKQVNNYDLSDKGRSAWTVDSTEPGAGNFCYGHRKVTSVDAWSPTTNNPGATTTVQYHYGIDGVPDWAKAAETQTAYPQLATASGTAAGSNTLALTGSGWQVNAPAVPSGAGTDADIVR